MLQIPGHPYRILIIGDSLLPNSLLTNSLFHLISQQQDIDKIDLYAKNPHEAKYQFLIKKRESTGLKHLNDLKPSTEYLTDMDGIYKDIEEHNPNKT